MEIFETTIEGLYRLKPRRALDDRGEFVKTYPEKELAARGFNLELREEFFSVSRKGVLRGMHFQVPPAAHTKHVYCLQGAILDVILDIRKGSRSFGRAEGFQLSRDNREGLLIPKGCAHGFLSLTDDSLVLYKTDYPHAPESDKGLRWDSFGFDWGVKDPLLSPRDRELISFKDYASPF